MKVPELKANKSKIVLIKKEFTFSTRPLDEKAVQEVAKAIIKPLKSLLDR